MREQARAGLPTMEGPMTTKDAPISVVQHSHDPVAAAAGEVARDLDVDPERGLSSEEAASRLSKFGPNMLAGGKKEPGWRAFLRQYEDFMQVILLAAALVNQLVTGENGTTGVLARPTGFHAGIGLRPGGQGGGSGQAVPPER